MCYAPEHINSPRGDTESHKQVKILLSSCCFISAPLSLCFSVSLLFSNILLHDSTSFIPPFILSFSHFQIFFCSLPAPRDPSLHPPPLQPTLLFPISTQGLMNAWPPIDRDG